MEYVIYPLLNMVTWYKNTLLDGIYNTLGKKSKEKVTSFKKLVSFLFKVPLHCLPSSKVFFVPYE